MEPENNISKESERGSLVWQCTGCSKTAPPTEKGYQSIRGHQNAHPKGKRGFALVDEETKEVKAENISEARDKDLLEPPPEPAKELQKKRDKGGETKEDDEVSEITKPQISSDGIFSYNISLPADAFALFNMAKAAGLEEDGKKPFDVWVWDCIKKRFEKDYKRRLVLAGIKEE